MLDSNDSHALVPSAPSVPALSPASSAELAASRAQQVFDPVDDLPPLDPLIAPVEHRRAKLEQLADRIAELSSHIQAATYDLLVLIREFDAVSGWSGWTSCAHWLSWRTGLASGPAREHVRVARALGELPKLSDAMRRGLVSYSKVQAVTRVAIPETEQALIDVALAGTAGDRYQVVLHVDGGALAEAPDVPAGTPASGGRQLRRSSLPCPEPKPAAAPEPAALSQTVLDEAGGIHVSPDTARRLACDSATVEMPRGARGEVLDVGRRRRTISPALRRALATRDGQCRFPGCGNRRCDAHHVEHWADGGGTALDNLVLMCRPPRERCNSFI